MSRIFFFQFRILSIVQCGFIVSVRAENASPENIKKKHQEEFNEIAEVPNQLVLTLQKQLGNYSRLDLDQFPPWFAHGLLDLYKNYFGFSFKLSSTFSWVDFFWVARIGSAKAIRKLQSLGIRVKSNYRHLDDPRSISAMICSWPDFFLYLQSLIVNYSHYNYSQITVRIIVIWISINFGHDLLMRLEDFFAVTVLQLQFFIVTFFLQLQFYSYSFL